MDLNDPWLAFHLGWIALLRRTSVLKVPYIKLWTVGPHWEVAVGHGPLGGLGSKEADVIMMWFFARLPAAAQTEQGSLPHTKF
jgi:hypothetical protein